MAPSQGVRNSELNSMAHRRHPSNLGQKYKPSENALSQYSPLRNQLSQQQIPQFVQGAGHVPGVISSADLRSLRQII